MNAISNRAYEVKPENRTNVIFAGIFKIFRISLYLPDLVSNHKSLKNYPLISLHSLLSLQKYQDVHNKMRADTGKYFHKVLPYMFW